MEFELRSCLCQTPLSAGSTIVRFLSKISIPKSTFWLHPRSDFLGSGTPSFGIHLSLLIVLELLRDPKDKSLNEKTGKCYDMADGKMQDQVEKTCLDFLRLSL
ncbi:hypothetical protein AVEN_99042-1 [Araneus ventricosus]|uniref:Uncharacterized protein n=1 Tax=Araneus ventricosus TaxID=182803 RepID=A0A4Y2Q3B8_ARAVE|nr:hypothetical protein AVEN_99042-1 [Araneus ventricosus]